MTAEVRSSKRTLDWDTVWEMVRDKMLDYAIGMVGDEELMDAIEAAVEANLAQQNRR
jgi:hypothetical protein